MTNLVEARKISKRFFETQALSDLSFGVAAGEVHALVGENGAGKSTLIKIFGGIHRPDSGVVRVAGAECRFRGPRDALAAGIVVIPQEMRVVPKLSVAENVLLGQTPTRRIWGLVPAVDRRAMLDRARHHLERLDFHADPDAAMDTLSFAERQLAVIARALCSDARVLILDEPTASLEHREVVRLFEVIASLKDQGVAIIYISHRLDEVVAIADRCTTMRDGRVVDLSPRGDIDTEKLTRLMTGRDLEELHRPHDREFGAPLLEADYPAPEGGTTTTALTLREREVTGLAGLLGGGTTEILMRLFGTGDGKTGVKLRGRDVSLRSPTQAIRAQLGMVPGERSQGLVMELSVRDNIVLPHLEKLDRLWRLDEKAIDALVDTVMESLDIRPRDPRRPVRFLSGGNQQKVIFARWLAGHADILLLDEPTHGIDIAAKAQIHRLMRHFVEEGGTILFASSEMIELLSISDSVMAMRGGAFVAHLKRDGDYNERALRAALGG